MHRQSEYLELTKILVPDWPAPKQVRACLTTRVGGMSRKPWDALNLATHVGDDPDTVQRNRELLAAALGDSATPIRFQWLDQVHGTDVVEAIGDEAVRRADALWTRTPGVACAVLTADCLPILICDRGGTLVAAVHAGWRGLAAGVIQSAIRSLGVNPGGLLAYLGPAICARCYEVGSEVRQQFLGNAHDRKRRAQIENCFRVSRKGGGYYWVDLYQLARGQLEEIGVHEIYGGDLCTVEEPERFYSYRREGRTGRQAALIWLE